MKPGDDRIEVLGLRVVARHGVLPEERERAQPFEIDLKIEADLSEAARHDDLSKTVDYGSVVEKVTEIATTRSFELLEALASAIAASVLDRREPKQSQSGCASSGRRSRPISPRSQ